MADIPRVAPLLLAALIVSACGQTPQDIRPLATDAVVMAYGDSLTFGTGAAPTDAYPAALAHKINRAVVNAGMPGETSGAGLARLVSALNTHAPDLVVLCHGGNDILRGRSTRELANNLSAMVELIRQHDADVVMLGVPSRSLTMRSAPAYAEVSEDLRVPLNATIVGSILRQPSLKSDQVHFNAPGYERLAEGVAELIRDSGGLRTP